jgi:NCS1 family nucleobase:cation symporter-1
MVQVIVIPVCFIFTAFMGIAIASGGYKVHNLGAFSLPPFTVTAPNSALDRQ